MNTTAAPRNEARLTLRPGTPADAEACGRICFDAFEGIARQHNYPGDFPDVGVAIGLMHYFFAHPHFFSVVATIDDDVVGSNFLDERSSIAGLGPITVSPVGQNRRVGRRLMEAALERAQQRGCPGVRLVQAAYHTRSLALYAGLGFHVRESLACLQGPALGLSIPGHAVRRAVDADVAACDRVCRQVHGHDRGGEVREAIAQGTATVVEHDGRITGYATDLAFFAHAVGETNADLMALIAAAQGFGGPGILLPLRNAAVLQWCLQHRMRIVQVMTLMSLGLYNEPAGAYLPSILY